MLSLAERKHDIMEYDYWISRKRAAMAMAEGAGDSEARLIHLHLAGCYSVKAAASFEGMRLHAPTARDEEPSADARRDPR